MTKSCVVSQCNKIIIITILAYMQTMAMQVTFKFLQRIILFYFYTIFSTPSLNGAETTGFTINTLTRTRTLITVLR